MKSAVGVLLLVLILAGLSFARAERGDLRDSPYSKFRRQCTDLQGYAILTHSQDMVCIKKESIIEIK